MLVTCGQESVLFFRTGDNQNSHPRNANVGQERGSSETGSLFVVQGIPSDIRIKVPAA